MRRYKAAARMWARGRRWINTSGQGRDMREGLPRASAARGAEGVEQGEVEDAVPRGAHIRLHGNTMHRLYIRTVGLSRATAVIGLINLTYNMSRYEQISGLNLLKK